MIPQITARFFPDGNRLILEITTGNKTSVLVEKMDEPIESISFSNGKWGYGLKLNPTSGDFNEWLESLRNTAEKIGFPLC